VGLFRCLGQSGQIRNVGIVDANVCGYGLVGGLVGFSFLGDISGCYTGGQVSGVPVPWAVRDRKCGKRTNSFGICLVLGKKFSKKLQILCNKSCCVSVIIIAAAAVWCLCADCLSHKFC
jgi:hypothetical protein